MTHLLRLGSAIFVAAASVLVLAGCIGIQTDELEPVPAVTEEAPSPTPAPEPTPLAVPERTPGELGRVVYTNQGAEGVPESSGEISAAPLPGVEYTVEAVCSTLPGERTARASFSVSTTDDEKGLLMSGTVVCDGDPWLMSGEMSTENPPQISFTATDGVDEAYARILPTEEFLGSP